MIITSIVVIILIIKRRASPVQSGHVACWQQPQDLLSPQALALQPALFQ